MTVLIFSQAYVQLQMIENLTVTNEFISFLIKVWRQLSQSYQVGLTKSLSPQNFEFCCSVIPAVQLSSQSSRRLLELQPSCLCSGQRRTGSAPFPRSLPKHMRLHLQKCLPEVLHGPSLTSHSSELIHRATHRCVEMSFPWVTRVQLKLTVSLAEEEENRSWENGTYPLWVKLSSTDVVPQHSAVQRASHAHDPGAV